MYPFFFQQRLVSVALYLHGQPQSAKSLVDAHNVPELVLQTKEQASESRLWESKLYAAAPLFIEGLHAANVTSSWDFYVWWAH